MRNTAVRLGIVCVLVGGAVHGQELAQRQLSLDFEGNRIFSKQELLEPVNRCLNRYSKPAGEYDEYCLYQIKEFLFSKGYLRAKVGEPRWQETETGTRVVVPIDEGALYRVGEIRIEGARFFTPAQLLELLELRKGDIADGEKLSEWAYELLKKKYEEFGYIHYTAEVEPEFRADSGARAGIVDFKITIDEGEVFSIRSIRFDGNDAVAAEELQRQMLLRKGDVFNRRLLEQSLRAINELRRFQPIDFDKDVNYLWDQKEPKLDLIIHLKRKQPLP